jgi:DNA-binding NarL/FixJ family response regulator
MTTPAKIKLIIADDHEVFRDGLKVLLNKQKNMTVIGEAANGEELVELYKQTTPDVVLTDIIMPVKDGIEAAREIKKLDANAKVIALSMAGDDNYVVDMLEAGAMGYLLKNAGKDEIVESILAVHNNTHYFANHTSGRLITLITRSKFNPRKAKLPDFNDVEMAIIRLICQQKTTKEIANEIFLGLRTVEGYRQRLQEKMGVKNTAGVVVYAVTNGLVQL